MRGYRQQQDKIARNDLTFTLDYITMAHIRNIKVQHIWSSTLMGDWVNHMPSCTNSAHIFWLHRAYFKTPHKHMQSAGQKQLFDLSYSISEIWISPKFFLKTLHWPIN